MPWSAETAVDVHLQAVEHYPPERAAQITEYNFLQAFYRLPEVKSALDRKESLREKRRFARSLPSIDDLVGGNG